MRKNKRHMAKHSSKPKKPNIFHLSDECINFLKRFGISLGVSVVAEVTVVLFLLYGPISFFRELIITSAMTTLSHQYYATSLYSDETIMGVLNSNKVEVLDTTTKTEDIVVDPNTNDITVRKISGKGWNGFIMEISNPSWVRLGIPENFGTKGQKIPRLIKDYGAVAGINAGGFGDANGYGNGGRAIGLVVVDGVTLQGPAYPNAVDVIGFNEDDVLVLGRYTKKELEALKLRDACEFTPFLIINGEPAEISGNGGWGTAPRTAIAQRKDGTVLFVVIDGRSLSSVGATIKQLQQVLIDENAYNAANLDGGSSTVLYYEDQVMNNPSGSDADGMRFLPNAWLVVDPETYEPLKDRPPYTEYERYD